MHLRKDNARTLNGGVKQALVVNGDVQFLWSMVSADWEEASASALLQMVVNQWVKICGFSYAGAWVKQYKTAQKKTTQKAKGVRKQLLPRPKQTPLVVQVIRNGRCRLEVAAGLASFLSFLFSFFPHSFDGYSDETYVHPSSKTLK